MGPNVCPTLVIFRAFLSPNHRICRSVSSSRVATVAISFLTLAVLLICNGPALAEPVWGELFTFKQPDGAPVELRIWGDEFYRVVESVDGYTLTRDPGSGAICYARLSADGESFISTGVRVDRAGGESLGLTRHLRLKPEARRAIVEEVRAQALAAERDAWPGRAPGEGPSPAPPLASGNVQGICLIVDFSDDPGTIPPSVIDDHCNLPGYTGFGNNGSVRDYVYDVSGGALTYTNFVPTVYYRAIHPKSYYDDCSVTYGFRARELVGEALAALDSVGFDFSQYDADGDGRIDSINCYYAGGRGCPWAQGLWPHSSTVFFAADGVNANRYQISDIGTSMQIRTFCHEIGHSLFYWPDLYDYGFESEGLGNYCVMSGSAETTNPPQPCAYLKLLNEWKTTTSLLDDQAGITAVSGSNTVYRYNHPVLPNEYYLIENRQRVDRDADIADGGLAIWHIDTQGSNNKESMNPEDHYKVTLVQADGNWDLEHATNSGDSTDMWSDPGYTECGPGTSPPTSWWNERPADFTISNISASGPAMTFDFSRTWKHYASATGGDVFPYDTPSKAAFSVVDAIDACDTGDTVYVEGAVFSVSALAVDESAVFSGGWDPTFTTRDTGAGRTVLDLGGTSNVLISGTAGPVTFDGFIIENGAGNSSGYAPGIWGGGVSIQNTTATVKHCEVRNSNATEGGGGVYAWNSTVTLEDCSVHDNTAFNGGGIYLHDTDATLTNVSATDNDITQITSAREGGGVYIEGGAGVAMTGIIIEGNTGATTGGGLFVRNASAVTLSGGSVSGHTVSSNGAGIYATGSQVTVDAVVLDHNAGVIGGAVSITAASDVTITDCELSWNSGLIGGGAYVSGGTANVSHNLFVGNSATSGGGGVFLGGVGAGTAAGNTFDRNTTVSGAGGMWLSNSPALDVYNNIVTASTGAGVQCSGVAPALEYNDVWNSSGSDYAGCSPGPGSISADPVYADTSQSDYRLAVHSPAIDTGRPGASYDDPDGSRGDMGRYGSHAFVMAQPSYVKNLVASLDAGNLVLTWDASPEGDVTQYAVYCDTVDGFLPGVGNLVSFVATPDTSLTFPAPNDTTYYQVTAIDTSGYAGGYGAVAYIPGPSAIDNDTPALTRLMVRQNAPNPFSDRTVIWFGMPAAGNVQIEVYDVLGRLVRRANISHRTDGWHPFSFDASDAKGRRLPAGVYFYRIKAFGSVHTKKMVLMR